MVGYIYMGIPVEELSNSHPSKQLFHQLDVDLQILPQLKHLLSKPAPSCSIILKIGIIFNDYYVSIILLWVWKSF